MLKIIGMFRNVKRIWIVRLGEVGGCLGLICEAMADGLAVSWLRSS